MGSIFYDLVSESELEDAHRIEAEGYPEDEAGSLDTFRYRQSQGPELFLGAYLPEGTRRRLIGYICSTLSPDTTLTHASMSKHIPGSDSVCIHSVCVSSSHRRQRVGLGLLTEYISRLSTADSTYARILLIAHEELRGFYEQAGFEWVGLSAVVHGTRPWYEMRRDLRARFPENFGATTVTPPSLPQSQSQSQSRPLSSEAALSTRSAQSARAPSQGESQTEPSSNSGSHPAATASSPLPSSSGIPAGLWEALQRTSSSPSSRPIARLLSSFPNAVRDVTSDIDADASAGRPTNKFDLLCPRLGCGSVILKAGVGSWVERASVQIDATERALPNVLGALPAPPATAQWWLVTPNAMAFENVGFSKPVQQTGPSGKRMKLLSCAECDIGPLGWCEEGGSEFWLACNRVGYRA